MHSDWADSFETCKTDTRKYGKGAHCCAISNNKDIQVVSKKKMGFLSDPKYMGYKGFQTADTAEPYFELMYFGFWQKISLLSK